MNINLSQQLANHVRQVYFGGNWTSSSLRKHLEGSTVKDATTKIGSLNTIVALAYHINYYLDAIMRVLDGGPLDAHDKYSFDHPPLESTEDWNTRLTQMWQNAEQFASRIEKLSDDHLASTFTDEKYGTYYRNIQGFIEHTHYHLGQIAIIKKMISERG